jgi:K+-transporting ATPase ATPase C chain
MLKKVRTAVLLTIVLTALTGVAYPLLVTGVSQVFFHPAAQGSLIEQDGLVRGSQLIGQPFTERAYFWSRPSATTPVPYNAASSNGSNLGPTNPALLDAVRSRIEARRAADRAASGPVPGDLVTASASGLDPHISPAAALYQVGRVAQARGVPEADLRQLVEQHIEGRQLGILGEPRINVLELNLALDRVMPRPRVK